jgi:hypothetical protein
LRGRASECALLDHVDALPCIWGEIVELAIRVRDLRGTSEDSD